MTRAELAQQNFMEGKTCAEAVLLAFGDVLGVCEKTLSEISRPFGGGMGRLRLTCGSVTGAVMALGLLFPELGKKEQYALVQEFAARFCKRNGSVVCGELLSGLAVSNTPEAEPRTEAYYKKRPCPRLVYDSAEFLEELCKERGKSIADLR